MPCASLKAQRQRSLLTPFCMCREKARVSSAMLVMDMQAKNVRLHWREPHEGDKLRYRQSQEGFSTLGDNASRGECEDSGNSREALRHMMLSLTPPETFIAAFSRVHLHETRADPRQLTRRAADFEKRWELL